MEPADDFVSLPLVDDVKVKDVFAEFCTGLNSVWQCAYDLCLGHGRS